MARESFCLRLSAEEKVLIEQACARLGVLRVPFIRSVAVAEARRVLAEQREERSGG